MKRLAIIVAFAALIALGAGTAHAAALVTTVLAGQVEKAGVPTTLEQRIYMTFRTPGIYPVPGPILSYASLAAFAQDAPKIQPACDIPDPATCIVATTVMYDTESWEFTPHPERTGKSRPYRYMREFIALAHSYGLKVGLCPSGRYLPAFSGTTAALRVAADFFVIQLSNVPGGRDLSTQVHAVTKVFVGPVYFKLSAIPGHDLTYLLRQWRTARRWTPHFVLWGGRSRSPESVVVAAAFLGRFVA